MKLIIKPKALLFSFALFMLIMQVVIQESVGIVKYYDEFITVVFILNLMLTAHKGIKKDIIIDLVLIFFIALLGILGNIVNNVQSSYTAIITDLGNMFKAFVSFAVVYMYFTRNDKRITNYYTFRYLNAFCRILVVPGVFLAAVNLVKDIGMHTEYVNGVRAFHYIFLRVGNLSFVCVSCLIIMTMAMQEMKKRERIVQTVFIVLTLLLLVSTLRARAIIFTIIYIIGYFHFVLGKKVKLRAWQVILVAAVGLYIGYPKLSLYFGNDTAARGVLLRFGYKTAVKYFPLGAGFASYGTFAARQYWSPLYTTYNFNNYYGLDRKWGGFLTDDYWPAIMAEFGFFGAILMLILIIRITVTCITSTSSNQIARFAAVFGITSMIISSFVSGSFFHTTSVLLMTLIAMSATNKKLEENHGNILKFNKRIT